MQAKRQHRRAEPGRAAAVGARRRPLRSRDEVDAAELIGASVRGRGTQVPSLRVWVARCETRPISGRRVTPLDYRSASRQISRPLSSSAFSYSRTPRSASSMMVDSWRCEISQETRAAPTDPGGDPQPGDDTRCLLPNPQGTAPSGGLEKTNRPRRRAIHEVELGGLEPPTSWVRSLARPPNPNMLARLERVWR